MSPPSLRVARARFHRARARYSRTTAAVLSPTDGKSRGQGQPPEERAPFAAQAMPAEGTPGSA
eukprot:5936266-Alexandrium_andersonii.AAC.1